MIMYAILAAIPSFPGWKNGLAKGKGRGWKGREGKGRKGKERKRNERKGLEISGYSKNSNGGESF